MPMSFPNNAPDNTKLRNIALYSLSTNRTNPNHLLHFFHLPFFSLAIFPFPFFRKPLHCDVYRYHPNPKPAVAPSYTVVVFKHTARTYIRLFPYLPTTLFV